MKDVNLHLYAVLKKLHKSMEDAADNKGVDYKINTSQKWNGTIGIRCNHVNIDGAPRYLGIIISYLSANQSHSLLEYQSLSKSFGVDKTTNRKRVIPWERTLYFTFYIPKEIHLQLIEDLPDAVENYRPLIGLVDHLGG